MGLTDQQTAAVRALLEEALGVMGGGTTPPPPPPPSDVVIDVPSGGDLQAVVNEAPNGATIRLEPGATFTGPLYLMEEDAYKLIITRGWEVVRGVRVTPGERGRMATIASPSTSLPALRITPGASYYRCVGVAFDAPSGTPEIVQIGGDDEAQAALADVPHHHALDRCLIIGRGEHKRGIALHGADVIIINSHVSNIWRTRQDSQAIGGWNGIGRYMIANNYLEGASENIMFGGDDPAITDLVAENIAILGNWLAKTTAWKGAVGKQVKNLLELKAARKVTIRGNLLEGIWSSTYGAAQDGYAVSFKVANSGGGCPGCTTEDVTFEGNVIRQAGAGIKLQGHDYRDPAGRLTNITIRGNLVVVDHTQWGGDGRFLRIGEDPTGVTVEGNTIIQTGTSLVYHSGPPTPGFVFRGNLSEHRSYGLKAEGFETTPAGLALCYPGGIIEGNVLAGGKAALYPAGNSFPAVLEWRSWFRDAANGDYRLREGCPWAGKGADVERLMTMVAAVQAGTATGGS